jgi:chromosome segregation protein
MTHRRVTMERSDVMYGVTLSEPGLSQIVSVKLEDWD